MKEKNLRDILSVGRKFPSRGGMYHMPTHRRRLRGGADDAIERAERRARRQRNREENGIRRRTHIVSTYHVDDLTLEEVLERHVEVIGHYVRHVHKFNVDGYQTKFVLKNLDEADNPVRVLERVMDWLMETATTNATEADYEVSDIGK